MSASAVIFLAVMLVCFCFGFVLLFGAPFVPTLRPQIAAALDLLALRRGDTLLELGCGDGRVLVAAAERGIKCIGYELNPILAFIAWARTRRFGSQVTIVCGDYWRAEWPEAQGIFAFILTRYMGKLHKKIMQYQYRPVKLASFAFEIKEKPATTTREGIFLYEYN